jgi:hypothetical protein
MKNSRELSSSGSSKKSAKASTQIVHFLVPVRVNGKSFMLKVDPAVLKDKHIFSSEIKLQRLTPEEIARWTKLTMTNSKSSRKLQIVYKSDTEMNDDDALLIGSPSKRRKRPSKTKSSMASTESRACDLSARVLFEDAPRNGIDQTKLLYFVRFSCLISICLLK